MGGYCFPRKVFTISSKFAGSREFAHQSPKYPCSIRSHYHELSAQLWSKDQLPLSCLEYEYSKIEILTYPGSVSRYYVKQKRMYEIDV